MLLGRWPYWSVLQFPTVGGVHIRSHGVYKRTWTVMRAAHHSVCCHAHVTIWINPAQWVIFNVSVPIQRLWIALNTSEVVWTHEPTHKAAGVESSAEVVQTALRIPLFAGEEVVVFVRRWALAERSVDVGGYHRAASVRDYPGRADLVCVIIVGRCRWAGSVGAGRHCEASPTGKDVIGPRP